MTNSMRWALTVVGMAGITICLASASASADVPSATSRDRVVEHVEVLLLGELGDGEVRDLGVDPDLEAYVVPPGRAFVLTDVNVAHSSGDSLTLRRDGLAVAILGTNGWPNSSVSLDLQSFASGPRFPAGSTVSLGAGFSGGVVDFVALRGYLTRD